MSTLEPSNESVAEIIANAPPPATVAEMAIEHVQGSSKWAFAPDRFYSIATNSCDIYGWVCLNFGLTPEVEDRITETVEYKTTPIPFDPKNAPPPNDRVRADVEIIGEGTPDIWEFNSGFAVTAMGERVRIVDFARAMFCDTPEFIEYENVMVEDTDPEGRKIMKVDEVLYPTDGYRDDLVYLSSPFITPEMAVEILHGISESNPVRPPWTKE